MELGYWSYLIDLISLAGSSPAMNDIIVNPTSTLVLSCHLRTSTFVIGQHILHYSKFFDLLQSELMPRYNLFRFMHVKPQWVGNPGRVSGEWLQ